MQREHIYNGMFSFFFFSIFTVDYSEIKYN